MTDTIREQCLVAFKSNLATLAGVTVQRNRDTEAERDEMPLLNMLDGSVQLNTVSAGFHHYSMIVQVEGFVKAANADLLGPALSDLYGKTLQKVLSNRTLGGIAIDVRESEAALEPPVFLGNAAGVAVAAFETGFIIEFSTVPGDPYTSAA